MDDAPLQRRLDAIERRLSVLVALVASGYLVAGGWLLVVLVDPITPWHAGVAVVATLCLGVAVAVGRRRASA